MIHRDVKPQNVIVPDAPSSRRGAAKLTDFGVAHLAGEDALTLTGDVVGTLAYMAPEQAAGRPVDERADLYALALVLYEAFAGANPVSAGSPERDRAAHRHRRCRRSARRRADLPPALCAALDRAVRPDPEERGGLDDLFDALADALGEVSDEGGSIAPHPLERGLPVLPPALGRLVAPAAAGGARLGRARRASRPIRRCRRRSRRSPWLALVAALPRARLADRRARASRCCSPSARRRGPGAAVLVARARRSRRRCCCARTAARGRCPPPRPRSACSASRAPTRRWRAARRAGPRGWPSARSARGGSCSPSRCSAARSSSAPRPARRRGRASTARPASPPAT